MNKRGLRQFRSELIREARRRNGSRARHRLASISIIAVAGVAVAGTAFATGLVGSDTESPPELTPVPNTASVVATAPDPDGGLDWGLRVSTSKTGGVCFTVDRIKDGRYGRLDGSGSFTEMPLGRGQSCGPASAAEDSLVGASSQGGTLVIHGVAGSDVAEVRIGDKRLTPTPRGGWLAAFRGQDSDLPDHPVDVLSQDGSLITYPWTGPPVHKPSN